MTQIRLFVSDMDGTLLRRNGTVSPYTAQVLKKLREGGCLVMVNSGRPFYSIEKVLDPSLYDIASCCNGQEIRFIHTGEIIRKPEIGPEDMGYLLQELEKYHTFLACTEDDRLAFYCSKKHTAFKYTYEVARNAGSFLLKKHRFPRRIGTDTSSLALRSHEKICFATFHHILEKIRRDLDPDVYSAFYVHPTWLEVQAAGISKGSAVRTVMERYGIAKDSCIAAGDGENDVSMLEEAGLKLVPKDGMKQAKKIADIITGTCEKDGVAARIEALIMK